MRMMWKGDLERWLLAQVCRRAACVANLRSFYVPRSQPLKRFDEHTVRFYAAQVVVALKALHMSGASLPCLML